MGTKQSAPHTPQRVGWKVDGVYQASMVPSMHGTKHAWGRRWTNTRVGHGSKMGVEVMGRMCHVDVAGPPGEYGIAARICRSKRTPPHISCRNGWSHLVMSHSPEPVTTSQHRMPCMTHRSASGPHGHQVGHSTRARVGALQSLESALLFLHGKWPNIISIESKVEGAVPGSRRPGSRTPRSPASLRPP